MERSARITLLHAWPLTLREEHRLSLFENRALMRMFGPKINEVIAGWRELHSEELHNLYFSQNIIRRMK
jgi:transposase InsO family protein